MENERRIIVELMSNADVVRLEAEIQALRAEMKSQEDRFLGLRRTVYELLERFSRYSK